MLGKRWRHSLPADPDEGKRNNNNNNNNNRYVFKYIKAFYLDTKPRLLDWIHQHARDYRAQHMKCLVACGVGAGMKKKERRQFESQIDALYKK